MKKTALLLIPITSLLLVFPLLAEESQATPARVIGKVADGTAVPAAQPKPLPNYQIRWGVVQHKKDHKVTINRVNPPEEPVKKAKEDQNQQDGQTEPITNQQPSGGAFFVYATTYDGLATRVRWHHEGQEFVAWSNVDWKYLVGFSSFEGRGKRYDFMLLHTLSAAEGVTIPGLPSLAEKGARYMVVKGDESNDSAMEFIEAIHDLYEAEKVQLKGAYQKRQSNLRIREAQKEAQRQNPPAKPDVIINYWKRHAPANTNQNK